MKYIYICQRDNLQFIELDKYPSTCVVILYYLEAAVRGVEIKQLDNACKTELKAYFKHL